MDNIVIKKANNNIEKELDSIGFDKLYLNHVIKKYSGLSYKIFNLRPPEANILKQLCLSLGFDCAVNRDTVTCKCQFTDALLFCDYSKLEKLAEKLKFQPFRLNTLSEAIENMLKTAIKPLKIRTYSFDWYRPYIMGILNVTPDSFSDGGKYNRSENALRHAIQMIEDGADFIDIGGESTRPDAVEISVDEEIQRVIPVLRLLRKENIDIPISIDTRNYRTARAAIEEGADIINDVSGLDYDENLFNYVTGNNIPCIIMHSDKVPAISSDYTNSDIVEDIYMYFVKKINALTNAGLTKENIILDTGIGFGKSLSSNYELLKRMQEFELLYQPMLLGISRKSFIRNKFNLTCEQSDIPTAVYSIQTKGVNIHRVHNVKLVKQYLEYKI
ncbi:MAG: dihydropteroate synthase [Candidatus Gastranaerophilales bacterium]|nr:dihydropteroate synthase [Candidatus Gastranaerophilales bacterium]